MKLVKKVIFVILFICFFTVSTVYADYDDDIYDGNYSIDELLKNYNIVTFGKKEIDSNIKNTYPSHNLLKGDVYVGHIVGRFLINGNLKTSRVDLRPGENDLPSSYKTDRISYFACGIEDDDEHYCFKDSLIYLDDNNTHPTHYLTINSTNHRVIANTTSGIYMNYDRLYDSIVEEQNRIKKGTVLDANDYTLEIDTGGYYYIEDISNVHDIIFNNFEKNKDEITVITVNNSGNITFPNIFADNYGVVATNDYIGMNRPVGSYASNYVLESYYGNVVWNFPNADIIYYDYGAPPMFGHVIAPKADVVSGKYFHVAGAYLVNSLYYPYEAVPTGPKSELHFYPLTKEIAYQNINLRTDVEINEEQGEVVYPEGFDSHNVDEGDVVRFTVQALDGFLFHKLVIIDEDGNEVEYRKVDDGVYEFIMPATDVVIKPIFKEKNIINIITNPYTGNKIIIVLFTLILLGFFGYFIRQREIKKKI